MINKRILLSANTSWNIYNFRMGIINSLQEQNCTIHIAAPKDEFSPLLEEKGCEFHEIKIDNKGLNPYCDIKTFIQYYRLYRRIKPDLVLHYTVKPNIYGALAARILGIPFINSVTGLGAVFLTKSWVTRLVKILYRVSHSKAHAVFFQNNDDKNLFLEQKIISKHLVRVVPGSGINPDIFHPVPLPDLNSGFKFLFSGRMLWDKGVGELVTAAKQLKVKYPEVKLQLLGYLDVENPKAISRKTMDQWVGEGTVDYLGSTDNVRDFISRAHCIVLPSYREGIPRSLLEAASMARPIIATNAAGCREVIDDGENGYLCRPKDAGDLASKMEKLLLLSEEERAIMGKKGRQKVLHEFDENIVISHYLREIYKILM
jgi:glycosyltransferase involved in cell wall biosynthesis